MVYEFVKCIVDVEQKFVICDGLFVCDGVLFSVCLQCCYQDCIIGSFVIFGCEGCYVFVFDLVLLVLVVVLKVCGIEQFYSYQVEVWEVSQCGEYVVIVIFIVSGKLLCYMLLVVSVVMQDKVKVLYLFLIKVLVQDQVVELLEFNCVGDFGVKVFIFDGDIFGDVWQVICLYGDIVVFNLDMLYQVILLYYIKWVQFFENLCYIVIDEVYIYRGVFGSYVINVLCWFKCICVFYGV